MALSGDPYKILELSRGASLAEIKRAYRRLAKANHPDTAGEKAIPRFLAIQAAYETLAGGDATTSAGGTGRSGPWQADPERARASRASWQDRARRRSGAEPGAGAGGGAGAEGGAAGSGSGAGSAAGSARPRGGAGSRRPRGERPPEAGPTRRRTSRPRGPADGSDRPPDRATPGSTSYDFADRDPFDPQWSGASWYGTTSGTYWTINPKEYADPRKHGPEYQARARRGTSPGGEPPEVEDDATPEPPPPRPDRRPRSSSVGGGAPPFATGTTAAAPAEAATPGLPTMLPLVGALRSRLALALVGWPPIGIAVALLLGELSGCGRFAASCVDTFALGTWIGQVAVIAALLVLPALAAIAAVGTLTTLAAAIPVAVLLSAVGGSREPGTAAQLMLGAMALAWLGGVLFAAVRRRSPP